MNPGTPIFCDLIPTSAFGTSVLLLIAMSLVSIPAHAGKTCGAFTVTIGTQVFSGNQTIMVPAANAEQALALTGNASACGR